MITHQSLKRSLLLFFAIGAAAVISYAQQRSVSVVFPSGTPPCRVHVQGGGIDTVVSSDWSYSAFKLHDQITLSVSADEPAVVGGVGGDVSVTNQPTVTIDLTSSATVFPLVTSRDPAVSTARHQSIKAGWRMLATPFSSSADPFPQDHGLEVGHVIMPGGGRFHPQYYAASALRIFYRQGLPSNLTYVGLRLYHSSGSSFTVIGSNILKEGGLAAGDDPNAYGVGSNWTKIPLQTATMPGSVAGADSSGWLELPLQWPVSDLGIWLSTNDAHDGANDWLMMVLTGPATSDLDHQPQLSLSWNESVAPAAPPVISKVSGNLTLKTGDSAVLSAVVSGYPVPTVKWLKDGAVIAGETGSTLSLSTVDTSAAGTYSLQATNSAGSVTQTVAVVTVSAKDPVATAPVISGLPTTLSFTEGDPISLAPSVVGSSPISFSWVKDGNKITGATSAILSIASATVGDAGKYILLASNAAGTASASVVISITVKKPTIKKDPAAASVVQGGSATFSVDVLGTGPFSFRWTKDGTTIVGANASTLAINNASFADAGTYVAYVSNAGGEVASAAATLTVTANVTAPQIIKPPQATTVHVGETAVFTAEATGTGPLGWQWWRNSLPITGATAPTLTVQNVALSNSGDLYRVQVTNTKDSVFSDSVQLTVLPAANAGSGASGTTSSSGQSGTNTGGSTSGSGSSTSGGSTGAAAGGSTGSSSTTSSGSGANGSTSSGGMSAGGSSTTGSHYQVSFDAGMKYVGYVGSTMMVSGVVHDGSNAPARGVAVDILDGTVPYPMGNTDATGHFSGGIPVPYVMSLGFRTGSVRVEGTIAGSFTWTVTATDLSSYASFPVDADAAVGPGSTSDMLAYSTNSGGPFTADDLMASARKVGNAFVRNASQEAITYKNSTSTKVAVGIAAVVCLTTFVGDELAGPVACEALVDMLAADAAHAAFRASMNTAIDVSSLSPAHADLARKLVTTVDAGTSAASSIGGAFGLARNGGALSVEKLFSPSVDAVRTVTDIVQNDSGAVYGYCFTTEYSDGTVRVFSVATSTPQMPAVLRSTSVRAYGGNNPVILGFIPKNSSQVLIQASGPTLGILGVTDAAFSTSMHLSIGITETDVTTLTTDWPAVARAESATGALRLAGTNESAAIANLTGGMPGTAVVDAVGGETLVELYPVNAGAGFKNLSARAYYDGQHVIHLGFTVAAYADMPLLIRGVGDELGDLLPNASMVKASGVSFTVWRIQGQQPAAVSSVTSVSGAAANAAVRVGAFPLHTVSTSAADLVRLPPGNYTAEVSAKTPGTVLVEIYDVE